MQTPHFSAYFRFFFFHKKFNRTEHHHSRETTLQLTRSVLDEVFNMRNNKVVRTFEFLLSFMEAGCFVLRVQVTLSTLCCNNPDASPIISENCPQISSSVCHETFQSVLN